MKKLLSILTISTLTASVPAPLLATAPLNRVKRDVGSSEKEENDDEILSLKKSKNILAIFNNDTFVEKLRQGILEIFNLRSYIEKNSSLSTYKIEPVKGDSIFEKRYLTINNKKFEINNLNNFQLYKNG